MVGALIGGGEARGKTALEVLGPIHKNTVRKWWRPCPERGWASLGKEILFIAWLGLTWTFLVHGVLGITFQLVGEWWEIPFREG